MNHCISYRRFTKTLIMPGDCSTKKHAPQPQAVRIITTSITIARISNVEISDAAASNTAIST
jgi:hypothetical protein